MLLWNSVPLPRYNKTRDDFESKEEWDTFLETVEDISEFIVLVKLRILYSMTLFVLRLGLERCFVSLQSSQ